MALYNICLLLDNSVDLFLQKHDMKIGDSLLRQKLLIVHMFFHNYTEFQFT